MTPEENLLAAANYLSEHGHHKGRYFANMGDNESMITGEGSIPEGIRARYQGRPACAMGALYITSDSCMTVELAADKVRGVNGNCTVPGWNDDPTTSAEDVILTMKRAAGL